MAAVALGLPSQAAALSRKQAGAAALAALKPATIPGRIAVYGLDAPLPAGASLSEAVNGRSGKPLAQFGHPTWLYWADLAHGALFEHASYAILVDDRTRKTTLVPLSWWPLVNRKAPAFYNTDDQVGRYLVWTNVPGLHATRSTAAARVSATRSAPPKNSVYTNDCLFLIGDRTDDPVSKRLFGNSLKAAKAWADAAGIRSESAAEEADLQSKIDEAVDKKGCKDVAIFLAGHGSPEHDTPFPGKPDAMVQGVAEPTVSLGDGNGVTAGGLRIIMDGNPKATFKLMVFSCFGGRFTTLSDVPNLAVISTSSSATEYSWGYIGAGHAGGYGVTAGPEQKNSVKDPKKLPGYVFGLLGALTASTTGSNPPDLVDAITQAHADSLHGDFAAKLGWTHPAAAAAGAGLKISPISAHFVQAEFATHYDVLVTDAQGRRITYSWKLTPPAVDAKCNNRGQPTSSNDEFVWLHGDQHGCDHAKMGPAGHLGTISLTVSDGRYVCTASYFGTNDGLGKPPDCSAVAH